MRPGSACAGRAHNPASTRQVRGRWRRGRLCSTEGVGCPCRCGERQGLHPHLPRTSPALRARPQTAACPPGTARPPARRKEGRGGWARNGEDRGEGAPYRVSSRARPVTKMQLALPAVQEDGDNAACCGQARASVLAVCVAGRGRQAGRRGEQKHHQTEHPQLTQGCRLPAPSQRSSQTLAVHTSAFSSSSSFSLRRRRLGAASSLVSGVPPPSSAPLTRAAATGAAMLLAPRLEARLIAALTAACGAGVGMT